MTTDIATRPDAERELLTHSRQDAFKTCRKRHWFAYEQGIRSGMNSRALRMGSAYHEGLELLGNGSPVEESITAVRSYYDRDHGQLDDTEWELESEIVVRLLCGYAWRWANDGLEYVACEHSWELPLLNPETGKPTPSFKLAGKIDGIVRQDGRLLVKESKLLSDDLGSDAQLWPRLRIDHQISMYVLAARREGFHVEGVLYDVTRKPTIGPRKLTNAEQKAFASLGEWCGEKFEPAIVERETPSMFGARLLQDIGERPDFYFARKEIPRLDQDLQAYEYELWDIQRTIRDAQVHDRWYRTANTHTCQFCPFFGPCTTGWTPTDALPEGFVRVTNKHPELGEASVSAT